MNIGRAVRVIRKIKNITQTELSKRTYIPKSTLSRIESESKSTSWNMIERICEGLEIKPSVLVVIMETDLDIKERGKL